MYYLALQPFCLWMILNNNKCTSFHCLFAREKIRGSKNNFVSVVVVVAGTFVTFFFFVLFWTKNCGFFFTLFDHFWHSLIIIDSFWFFYMFWSFLTHSESWTLLIKNHLKHFLIILTLSEHLWHFLNICDIFWSFWHFLNMCDIF